MTQPSKTQGQRHYCTASINGGGYLHTSGDGAPRRKKCAYCGGMLAVQRGTYGVFAWRGDGRYALADAIKVFAREAKANAYVDTAASTHPGGVVVRWICE